MGFPKELKLKKHETFSIREGWLEKALHNIPKNPSCFSKDNGMEVFGLGSNMVKSLKYWVRVTGIATYNKVTMTLTDFGKKLCECDEYLDSDFSWWLIHVNLVTNFEDAPVFNRFFNNPFNTYEKGYLVTMMKEEFEHHSLVVNSISSLDADISVLLKSYYSDDYSSPENNMSCPLSRLNLLSATSKKEFKKKAPAYESLDARVVYYALYKYFELRDELKDDLSFNIEDVIKEEDNPMAMLNITRSSFYNYLEELKRMGYLEMEKTAGLNTVYISKFKTVNDLIDSYFEVNKDVQ